MGLISCVLLGFVTNAVPVEEPDLRAEFLRLCDMACVELNKDTAPFDEKYRNEVDPATHHVPFFEDSYAVRALCVAFDLTGKAEYLDACKRWAERIVAFQDRMIPSGAYYLNYFREPGKSEGDWFVADSGSIAMGVLAVAVRMPQGPEHDRYVRSVRSFAKRVMDDYTGEEGGITDGLWSSYSGEWWCSTATFGAFLFLLHAETGERPYREAAVRALEWLSHHDLRKAEHISFDECAPGVVFYCGECYAAAFHVLGTEAAKYKEARAQVEVALQWMAENQKGRGATTHWDYLKEATYMGGTPFLLYAFARMIPEHSGLVSAADDELRYIADLLSKDGPPSVGRLTTWELLSWTMVSYAERLAPGTLYRTSFKGSSPALR